MEDAIHKSGALERWRFVSRRTAVEPPSRKAPETMSQLAVALRRTLDVLKEFPEALDAVQRGLKELAEAPS